MAVGKRVRRRLRHGARPRSRRCDGIASSPSETSSWPYQHDRDLTGFIDGSENPTLVEAPGYVVVPEGSPGAGGTVLLLQKWAHDAAAWEGLPVAEQERVIGRTKPDSVELDDKPDDSHVASTDQDTFGHIFRRNMPYGTITDHGTMFVGFAADAEAARRRCWRAWPASSTATRDALTRLHAAAHGRLLLRALDRLAPAALVRLRTDRRLGVFSATVPDGRRCRVRGRHGS